MRRLISSTGRTLVVAFTVGLALTGQALPAAGASGIGVGTGGVGAAAGPAPAVVTRAAGEIVTAAASATDPGVPGTLDVVTEDYELDPIRIAPLPEEVEMVGHVVRPQEADPAAPLVLFLHGAHDSCYDPTDPGQGAPQDWPCPRGTAPVPSHLGYDYLQRLLASQGYVTVSIAANGVNAQSWAVIDDLGADARGTLVRRHLARWAAWDAAGDFQVDMHNVVLVGHSRGGEGVNRATAVTPLSAPYRITGQILIAPTNSERSTASYVPTVTFLPYCDGDVRSLEGQRYLDLGRDLAADDAALRSTAVMLGANHNFFNTEWTPGPATAPASDDWGGPADKPCGKRTEARLTAGEQRAVARAYVGGAVALMARADSSMLPMFDGTEDAEPASAGDATVLTHLIGAGRELRKPGAGLTVAADSTAEAFLCVGRSDPGQETALARVTRPNCGRGVNSGQAPHWPASSVPGAPAVQAIEMAWDASGEVTGLQLTRPLDLSSAPALDLRTVVDPMIGGVRLELRLHDTAGSATGWLTPAGGAFLPPMPRGAEPLSKRLAQTLRLPTQKATGVDLAAVNRIDVRGSGAVGRIWVLDLAASTSALAPVPDRRLPVLSLGNLRVQEGDRPSTRLAEVPYTVTGTLDRRATVAVQVFDPMKGRFGPSLTVVVPAGTTAGVIEVPYPADDADDLRRYQLALTAYAVRNLAVRDAHSLLWILDDDPAPSVTLTRVDDAVREGSSARWRVTLSTPVDYELGFTSRVVRGDVSLPRVRVGDLPRAFRDMRVDPSADPDAFLHTVETFLDLELPKGRTTGVLEIPLRADRTNEGREAISLQVSSEMVRFTSKVRTVVVKDG
jgi:hypothetical protein